MIGVDHFKVEKLQSRFVKVGKADEAGPTSSVPLDIAKGEILKRVNAGSWRRTYLQIATFGNRQLPRCVQGEGGRWRRARKPRDFNRCKHKGVGRTLVIRIRHVRLDEHEQFHESILLRKSPNL